MTYCPCPGCLGNGACWVCLGTGAANTHDGNGVCHSCDGSRQCHYCTRAQGERIAAASQLPTPREELTQRDGAHSSNA